MQITYKKNDNSILFNNKNKELLNLTEIQNYIPLFKNFFNLTNNNYANFNINYPNYLIDILEKESYNKYKCILLKDTPGDNFENKYQEKIFFKFCPLLDPIKFICNKYDLSKNLITLPKFNLSNNCHEKVQDINNAAYVDGFFTFLTSQLLHHHNFIHGVDCFGTFLGIKENLLIDIGDDIDFLYNSEDFHKNNNILFNFTNLSHIEKLNFDTRNNKKKLLIDNNIITDTNFISLSNINDFNKIDKVFVTTLSDQIEDMDNSNNLIFEYNLNKNSKKIGKNK